MQYSMVCSTRLDSVPSSAQQNSTQYLIVLYESRDCGRGENGGIVRVEREAVLVVLDPSVQRPPVLAERHREQVLLLG